MKVSLRYLNNAKEIYRLAKDFQQNANLSPKDALHLACAYHTKCGFFLTCDDELIKRAKRLNLDIRVINPVDYIREVEKYEDKNHE